MGRVARKTFPAYGVWHVTTRGVERRRVYLDRDDGLRFLAQLWRAVERWELETHALCLMPNHYHSWSPASETRCRRRRSE